MSHVSLTIVYVIMHNCSFSTTPTGKAQIPCTLFVMANSFLYDAWAPDVVLAYICTYIFRYLMQSLCTEDLHTSPDQPDAQDAILMMANSTGFIENEEVVVKSMRNEKEDVGYRAVQYFPKEKGDEYASYVYADFMKATIC